MGKLSPEIWARFKSRYLCNGIALNVVSKLQQVGTKCCVQAYRYLRPYHVRVCAELFTRFLARGPPQKQRQVRLLGQVRNC